jgi:antitoxin component HigA of HigAB toxin-antitoxin module
MKTATAKRHRASDRHLDLIHQFPPAAPRSEANLKAATAILDQLFARDHVDLYEEDYVHVLTGLVEEYEAQRHAVDLSNISAARLLRHLMTEHDMTQLQLAKLLGVGPSAASMIRAR